MLVFRLLTTNHCLPFLSLTSPARPSCRCQCPSDGPTLPHGDPSRSSGARRRVQGCRRACSAPPRRDMLASGSDLAGTRAPAGSPAPSTSSGLGTVNQTACSKTAMRENKARKTRKRGIKIHFCTYRLKIKCV